MSQEQLAKLAVTEPKKVFINIILIPQIRTVVEAIYHSSPLHAIRPLRGLISCLDKNAQKQLAPQAEKLNEFERNPKAASRAAIEQLFQEVMVFLHETYLRGFHVRLDKEDFDKLEDKTT